MVVSLLNQLMVHLMPLCPQAWVWPLAKRYIAGVSTESLLETVRQLNAAGAMATVDVLGEFITRPEEAQATAQQYQTVLSLLAEHQLDANISVKLTALGLLLDPALCEALMRDLLSAAKQQGNFVRIDMEDATCTQATIALYLKLREDFDNVGLVLQAYLKRTGDDVSQLIAAHAAHIRLCKGIYVEHEDIAFKHDDAIRTNYLAQADRLLSTPGAYLAMATHDDVLVQALLKRIAALGLAPEAYEFQMLLGVTEGLRARLIAAGHRVRVYVPYGEQWHAYCLRRMKENPKLAGYVIQNLLAQLGQRQ